MINQIRSIEKTTTSRILADLKRHWLQLIVLTLGCFFVGLAIEPDWSFSAAAKTDALFLMPVSPSATAEQGLDFSRFLHSNRSHERLPCLLCHRRESNAPRPIRSLQHTP